MTRRTSQHEAVEPERGGFGWRLTRYPPLRLLVMGLVWMGAIVGETWAGQASPLSPVQASESHNRGVHPGQASQTERDQVVQASISMGRRVALIIGSASATEFQTLKWVNADASSLEAALKGVGFAVTLLLDARETTRQALVEALTSLPVQPSDEVLVYFAGHALVVEGQGTQPPRYVLVTTGTRKSNPAETGLDVEVLLQHLSALPARHRALLLDACFDGEGGASSAEQTFAWNRGLMTSASTQAESAATLFFAARPGGKADESDGLQHGYFTGALLEVFGGEANADLDQDSAVYLWEAVWYVQQRVEAWSERQQLPAVNTRRVGAQDLLLLGQPDPSVMARTAYVMPLGNNVGVEEVRVGKRSRGLSGPPLAGPPRAVPSGLQQVQIVGEDKRVLLDALLWLEPQRAYTPQELLTLANGSPLSWQLQGGGILTSSGWGALAFGAGFAPQLELARRSRPLAERLPMFSQRLMVGLSGLPPTQAWSLELGGSWGLQHTVRAWQLQPGVGVWARASLGSASDSTEQALWLSLPVGAEVQARRRLGKKLSLVFTTRLQWVRGKTDPLGDAWQGSFLMGVER